MTRKMQDSSIVPQASAPSISPPSASPTSISISSPVPLSATNNPYQTPPFPLPFLNNPSSTPSTPSTPSLPSSDLLSTSTVSSAIGSPYPLPSTSHAVVKSKSDISPFILKTFTMVSDPNVEHIVSWSPNGDQLIVKDEFAFASTLIPHYFRHRNFSSFVRQLNFYGFHKRNHEGKFITFYHPYFQRGRVDLLSHIKRKTSEPNPHAAAKSSPNSPSTTSSSASNVSVRDTITNLKKQIQELYSQYDELYRVQHRILYVLSHYMRMNPPRIPLDRTTRSGRSLPPSANLKSKAPLPLPSTQVQLVEDDEDDEMVLSDDNASEKERFETPTPPVYAGSPKRESASDTSSWRTSSKLQSPLHYNNSAQTYPSELTSNINMSVPSAWDTSSWHDSDPQTLPQNEHLEFGTLDDSNTMSNRDSGSHSIPLNDLSHDTFNGSVPLEYDYNIDPIENMGMLHDLGTNEFEDSRDPLYSESDLDDEQNEAVREHVLAELAQLQSILNELPQSQSDFFHAYNTSSSASNNNQANFSASNHQHTSNASISYPPSPA